MTDLDPRYRGKDFLIGFLPSLIIAGMTAALLFATESFTPLGLAGAGLVVAAIAAFIHLRPFIALGIITVLVATPLLLIGSCFALFAFNQ